MKTKWTVLIIIIVGIISGAIIYLKTGASKDFGPLVKTKLQKLVKEGSNGLYTLSMDSIRIDVIKGQIVLHNINLKVDSIRLSQLDSLKQAPNDVFYISLKTLLINGIGPADILDKKNISLNKIMISNPTVEFFHQKRDYNYSPPDTINLYRLIQKNLGHFSVNDLQIENVDITYHNIKNKTVTKFKNTSLHFNNILVDSATQNDKSRFLYARNAFIFLHDYNIITSDKLYIFHFDSAMLNAGSHEMTLTRLSFKPTGEKNEFSKKLPYYEDRYDINIQNASIKKIDWYDLLAGENFTAQQAKIANGTVEVFADRTLPPFPKSKIGNYPHQLLMKIKLPVYISKIEAENIKVTYKELNPKSKKTGELIFADIKGTFTNINNEKEIFKKDSLLQLDAVASFMNATPLHAIFRFNLNQYEKGTFSVDAEFGSMDATKLTNTTSALGLFEINRARINKLVTHIRGDNNQASGTLMLLYDSLKITALKPNDEKGDLKKRGLISFVANNLILEKSNTTTDENSDIKKISSQRDIHKSFFNLIWKSMLDGIKKTVKGKD